MRNKNKQNSKPKETAKEQDNAEIQRKFEEEEVN